MGNIGDLHFDVILDDKSFKEKIESVKKKAEELNTSLSTALKIQMPKPDLTGLVEMSNSFKSVANSLKEIASVSKRAQNGVKQVASSAKDGAKEASGSLAELNRWYKEMENAEWTRLGKDINLAPYVERSLVELKKLEEELNLINELRKSEGGSGDFRLAEDYASVKSQADKVVASINAMRDAQRNLDSTAKDSVFKQYIESLTQVDFGVLQSREFWADMEKNPQKFEEAFGKALDKQRQLSEQEEKEKYLAEERLAVQRRIEENKKSELSVAEQQKKNEEYRIQKAKQLAGHKEDERKLVSFTTEQEKELVRIRETLNQKIREGEAAQKKFSEQIKQSRERLISMRDVTRTIAQLTGVYFGLTGVRRFLSSLIDITGQFEMQKMALRNMLQDLDGADKIFEDLYRFSSESTYRFSELAKYAKQLAAFNIDQNSLLETTKMLGDVASGVGVSMDKVILAYGHVKSSGFLRGIQLRSFSQNGVPVLEELSKMLTEVEGKTVSLGDVFDKMTKREITFEMVEEAFKRMTSEGGKFYQMQEVLAKTLAGQINILKGKWENLMYAIGESQEGILKGAVQALTKIVSSTESFGKAVTKAVVGLGVWRTGAIIAAAATDTLTASQIRLITITGKLVSTALNPYVLFATAIAATVGAIVKAEKDVQALEASGSKVTEALTKNNEKYISSLASENDELEALYERLRHAKQGTDEYAAAKHAIENRFGPYINQLKAEGVEVDNLSTLYTKLAEKIRDATKQRFLESAQQDLLQAKESEMESIGGTTNGILEQMGKRLKGKGGKLSQSDQMAIRAYISGDTNALQGMSAEARALLNQREKGIHKNKLAYANYTFLDQINDAADAYKQTITAYTDGMMEAEKWYQTEMAKLSGDNDDSPVTKISLIVEAIKKYDQDIEALRNKAKASGITLEEEEKLKQLITAREDEAKRYKEIMGVDYDKQAKKTETEQEKAIRERIASLKSEISVLEKYRTAREKLEPYFGSDTDNQLAKIFGDDNDYSSLNTQILTLCDSLRQLGKDGIEAAEQIDARLGMDALSLLLAKQRDLKKYDDNLKKYLGEDFSYSGSSLEYKTSRILAEYNTKVATATREYEELHKNLVALGQDTSELEAQFQAQLAQLAADRDNKIAELAKSIYGKQTGNLNLTEWAHKSGKEIKEIIAALRNIQVPKELADMLDEGALNALSDALKELASEDIEKALTKLDDNRLRNLQKAASVVSSIAGAVKEYAEASGNDNLAAMAEALSFIADTAGAVFDRLAQGDYAGAVLAVVGGIAKEIMAAATAAAQLNAALAEAVEKSRVLGMSKDLKAGVENLFGESGLRKIRNAAELAEKLRKTAYTGKGKFLSGRDAFFLPKWETMIGNLAAGVGGELYDDYGNLNADTLKLILETYKKLDTESKQWIQHAIDDTEAYKDAMEQLDGVVKDVFGNIAGQTADKIVEQWKARGDAALDYADILDDVATRYAKMITESMLIDSVLTPDFKDQLTALVRSGDTENAMGLVLSGLEQIQLMAPAVEAALEPLLPYIKGGSSSDSLKDGINKELVEGNSSLIASYMNAMRADLSVIRMYQAAGWQDVRLIRESTPSLVEYTAQIAANTFDSAQASNAILSKLQSIITPSTNGGSAVRTTK